MQQKTRSNGVCHFMGHFLPSYHFNNPKSQNFEKIKKMPGDNIIFLFRTTMTIMWCMVPEISSRTDIIFCHFGPFFVLLPLEISLFYTREDGWCKKDKKIDWNTSFLKKFTSCKIRYKSFRKSNTVLNQSTIERLSLIHQQVNLMKCVESNKFDNVYRKIWSIFV